MAQELKIRSSQDNCSLLPIVATLKAWQDSNELSSTGLHGEPASMSPFHFCRQRQIHKFLLWTFFYELKSIANKGYIYTPWAQLIILTWLSVPTNSTTILYTSSWPIRIKSTAFWVTASKLKCYGISNEIWERVGSPDLSIDLSFVVLLLWHMDSKRRRQLISGIIASRSPDFADVNHVRHLTATSSKWSQFNAKTQKQSITKRKVQTVFSLISVIIWS